MLIDEFTRRVLKSLYLMLIVIFFYFDQNILNSICVRFNRNFDDWRKKFK